MKGQKLSKQLQNLISIVGMTAVGKTSFALVAAEKILAEKKNYQGIDLISADSRQVYQGLEIVSGADAPTEFKQVEDDELSYPYFEKDKISLHGVSLIKPDQEWSLSHFHQLAWEIIEFALAEERLPLVVGGTGLYHEQLFNFDPALKVGPDSRVRNKVEQMTVRALQDWARQVNPERFTELNRSDRYNPRRLVRVIEVGLAEPEPVKVPSAAKNLEQVFLGLEQDLVLVEKKIKARVKKRLELGALAEVKKLNLELDSPAASALGVSEIKQYLAGELTQSELIELWSLHEIQYARQQLTWWAGKTVCWFNLADPEWKSRASAYILELC